MLRISSRPPENVKNDAWRFQDKNEKPPKAKQETGNADTLDPSVTAVIIAGHSRPYRTTDSNHKPGACQRPAAA
jgi:hypothetical protein